jgi:hypothetical protein
MNGRTIQSYLFFLRLFCNTHRALQPNNFLNQSKVHNGQIIAGPSQDLGAYGFLHPGFRAR